MPKRRKAPTKFSRDIQDRIVAALARGSYIETAVKAAGISRATYFRWLKAGREEAEGPFRDFVEAVRQADAVGETALVTIIQTASSRWWQAAAWLLERKYPARWGRKWTKAIDIGSEVASAQQQAQDLRDALKSMQDATLAEPPTAAEAPATQAPADSGETPPPC